mmetsp:Transcript_86058/g.230327  ORF Transcript_86058/g.230327 Transcript_86058/m.230327 type:complete len:351 (-) Transcript_86058:353-1405(-)
MGCSSSAVAVEDKALNLAGQRFTRQYEPGQRIGRGSFGTVKEARAVDTKQIFAAKIIAVRTGPVDPVTEKEEQLGYVLSEMVEDDQDDSQIALDKKARKLRQELANMTRQADILALRTEEEIMNRCAHRHVLRLRETFKSSTHWIFVMPVMACSLKTHAGRKGAVIEAQCARYIREISDGVAYMHHKRIIHRDLKPSNILVDLDGHAVIGDLGLAQALPAGVSAVKPSRAAGTRSFFGPEVWLGDGQGAASDVWALGCIMYWLLFGGFLTVATLCEDLAAQPSPRLEPRQVVRDSVMHILDDVRSRGRSAQAVDTLEQIFEAWEWHRPTAAKVMRLPWVGGVVERRSKGG